jgi:hypothetical protein
MKPAGSVVVVMTMGTGPIPRVAARVAVSGVVLESVTWTVKLDDPAAVGVPESTPAVLSVRPAGNVPTVTFQVNGDVPPVAAKVWLYATPTVPPTRGDVVVIETGVGVVVLVEVAVLLEAQPTSSSATTAASITSKRRDRRIMIFFSSSFSVFNTEGSDYL